MKNLNRNSDIFFLYPSGLPCCNPCILEVLTSALERNDRSFTVLVRERED